jgi:hypothetical protein
MDEPGFDLGFGLQSGKELPAEIGSWSIEYITKKKGATSHPAPSTSTPKNKESIAINKCDPKSLSWKSATSTLKAEIANMNCSKVFERNIQGSYRSPVFSYVKIGLKECVGSRN